MCPQRINTDRKYGKIYLSGDALHWGCKLRHPLRCLELLCPRCRRRVRGIYRIKEFAQLYDAIKSERNKCVSLIQASTQKATEVKEKLKIFDNETEILRTSVGQKEK